MKFDWIATIPLLTVLAACGSTSETGLPTTLLPEDSQNVGSARVAVPANTGYDTIDGTSGVVTILEGIGTTNQATISQVSDADPSSGRVYIYGYRDSSNDTVYVTDTFTILDDTDGDSSIGDTITYTNTDAVSTTQDRQVLRYLTIYFNTAVNYDYARQFDWTSYDDDGVQRNASVILGVTTRPEDMPGTGVVTYSGDALIARRSNSTSFGRGTSTVNVDFSNGFVDVETAVSTIGVNADDMVISSNGFTGGTVTLTENGIDATDSLTGGVVATDAVGLFFGPSSATRTAEIGGVITVEGVDSTYSSYFLAD